MSSAPTPHPPLPSQVPTPLSGWPVLRLGFRPFYLLTAAFACLAVPVWVAAFLGYLPWNRPLSALLWHGHEMLFGFAAGVVIGFLLTAVRAWTGAMTARGPLLGALALLWLAARVAAVTAPYAVFAVLDTLLLQAGNKRNIPLIGLLLLMGVANLLFHLSVLQVLALDAIRVLHAQLALILLVVTVITGRVVPMFTRNATPGLVIQVSRGFELTLLALTALTFVLWVCAAPLALLLPASVAAALMHAVRLYRWSPWVTRTRPILWVLHLAYAWMPVGFVLLALAQLGWVGESLAVHAFAVGAMGGLII